MDASSPYPGTAQALARARPARATRGGASLADRLLYELLLSLSSDAARRTEAEIDADVVDATLHREPFLRAARRLGDDFDVCGRRVLEVGCGAGDLAVCMALAGADVTAVDVDGARIEQAKNKRTAAGVRDRLRFVHADFLDLALDETFERIVSLEAFEHLPEPERFLRRMADLLAPGGRILSIWGPTWLSPFGAHALGFTKVPWVHLLFPERVVLAVRRAVFRPTDPATRYEDIRGGLNRMTVGRFRRCVADAGLRLDRLEVNPQFRSPPLRALNRAVTSLPAVGELFSHTVLCVMSLRRGAVRPARSSPAAPPRRRRGRSRAR